MKANIHAWRGRANGRRGHEHINGEVKGLHGALTQWAANRRAGKPELTGGRDDFRDRVLT
jgi:hypothetical protein